MPTSPPTTSEASLRRRTIMAYRIAARDLRECQSRLESLGVDDPRELVRSARMLGLLDKRLKAMTVILAVVVHATPWADVADDLGMSESVARGLYEEAVERWKRGDPAPWAPVTKFDQGKATIMGALPIVIPDDDDGA